MLHFCFQQSSHILSSIHLIIRDSNVSCWWFNLLQTTCFKIFNYVTPAAHFKPVHRKPVTQWANDQICRKSVIRSTLPLTPPRRLSSYDDGEENAAHPHMMICRLRRNACIEERCQKGKEDLSQASFKYTHFAVAGKSSYEDERRSLRHHHMMISDAEGLKNDMIRLSDICE